MYSFLHGPYMLINFQYERDNIWFSVSYRSSFYMGMSIEALTSKQGSARRTKQEIDGSGPGYGAFELQNMYSCAYVSFIFVLCSCKTYVMNDNLTYMHET